MEESSFLLLKQMNIMNGIIRFCRINLMLIVIPTCAQISNVKLILKSLRHVSVLIHHLQGVEKLRRLKLWIIKMIR